MKTSTALAVASLCVAAIAIAGCKPTPHQLTPGERSTSELGARDYAERVGGSFVSCSGQDSDKDGYVSCDVNLKTGPQGLVCSYADNARGCKRKP